MRRLFTILILVCLGSAIGAKADPILTGGVGSQIYGGSTCSKSGGPSSSISLSCTDVTQPQAYSTLTGNVGATSGSVAVNFSSALNGHQAASYESAMFGLSVTGIYELTGGTGFGYADLGFDVYNMGGGGGGNFSECMVTLDGQSQTCGGYQVLDFYVPYNTPLNLSVAIDYSGSGEYGDGANAGVMYDLSALTPEPTPEPVSLLLLGTGMIPVVWRMRQNRRKDVWR